ncbi:Pentatricopeptide repeat-containing protein [Dichanthelium oligosanthes]|uniref:Pentatricopeptide repeat-containing protein n=1 Tax=Dichanthelium oligosanthes TaxID=888268 RepID=A0A1E5W780_9POAL|nr:Pentatricopeptide repeat-containing protein [Dichanthelium oligosanthes]
MPPRASPLLLLSRGLSAGPPHRDHPELAALRDVLTSPRTSSTPLPHALSRAFPSPSNAFPLRTLPRLLPLLPSPLLSLRFLLWRLTPSSPPPSPHALSSLATSLPDLSSSLPLLLSSSPQPLPLPHYALLLNISAHADLFAASLAVLRHMRSFRLVPDAACFHHALRAAGSASDVSAVLEIMSGSGASPTVPVIVTAVHKLASSGNFEGARRLIDKMPEFGCVPTVVVYTAMVDGMCSFRNVDGVMRLIEEMEGSGLGANCAPNVVTYTCLVKCLCGKGRVAEALNVLDRMAQRGVMPNRVFVRTLVEGVCTDQRVSDAYDVVERVVGDGAVSSGQCYNVLLICLWRVGMTAEAEGLAQRMLKKGVQLTPLAGSSMVRELCVRKRLLDACHWLGMMEENGVLCDSDVYGTLLLGLCEEGHVHEASALGWKVVKREIHIEASCAERLVELLKQYGDEELASHLLGLKQCP